jgi:hypothetical protein
VINFITCTLVALAITTSATGTPDCVFQGAAVLDGRIRTKGNWNTWESCGNQIQMPKQYRPDDIRPASTAWNKYITDQELNSRDIDALRYGQ